MLSIALSCDGWPAGRSKGFALPAGSRPLEVKEAIIARRGPGARNIAKTAAARVLLTQVFYALRDGYVRRATHPAA